jgi:hypothetical protein
MAPMALTLQSTVVDCNNAKRVGEFWAALLDRPLQPDPAGDDDVEYWLDFGTGPDLLFLAVPDAKSGKNRLHIDLRPDDQAAEVERALALGARHVDIGQGEQTWVVLADPEGNEFCILRALRLDEQ